MLLPTRVARCVQFSHWAGFLIFVFHETKLKSRNFVFLSKFLARSQPWGFSPYTHEKVWYTYHPTPLPRPSRPPPPLPILVRYSLSLSLSAHLYLSLEPFIKRQKWRIRARGLAGPHLD